MPSCRPKAPPTRPRARCRMRWAAPRMRCATRPSTKTCAKIFDERPGLQFGDRAFSCDYGGGGISPAIPKEIFMIRFLTWLRSILFSVLNAIARTAVFLVLVIAALMLFGLV